VKITKRKDTRVPWLELGKSPADYLDVDTIPEGFKVLDPSKMTKNMITQLWDHWTTRAEAKKPILRFLKAQDSDLGLSALARAVERAKKQGKTRLFKRAAYIDDIGSDDQSSDSDGDDGANSSNGMSRAPARPPPSKRPRLRLSSPSTSSTPPISEVPTLPISECPTPPISEALTPPIPEHPSLPISEASASPNSEAPTRAVPGTLTSAIPEAQEQSLAANNMNREHFLYNLSSEASYKTLLNGVLALPSSVSLIPPFICMYLSNYC
jgi:hypothetical protein